MVLASNNAASAATEPALNGEHGLARWFNKKFNINNIQPNLPSCKSLKAPVKHVRMAVGVIFIGWPMWRRIITSLIRFGKLSHG
jgi:hypothetical protein